MINPSGKSGFYLLTLECAYHDLMTVLSIVKSNVAKPNHAWAKPSLPMNLTYPRLIPDYSGLGLSVGTVLRTSGGGTTSVCDR